MAPGFLHLFVSADRLLLVGIAATAITRIHFHCGLKKNDGKIVKLIIIRIQLIEFDDRIMLHHLKTNSSRFRIPRNDTCDQQGEQINATKSFEPQFGLSGRFVRLPRKSFGKFGSTKRILRH